MTIMQHLGSLPFVGLLALSACAASGSGGGLVSAGLAPAGRALFSWTTHGGATAELSATMPDGERFTGPATSLSTQTQAASGFYLAPGKKKPALLFTTPTRTWTGEIEALLTSGSGRSMQCRLHERHPGRGLEGGASGSCALSDGRRIAASF